MPLIPRRFRPPKAEVQIEARSKTPPDLNSGGAFDLKVYLLPQEPFVVKKGWLELSLSITRFSRTVLDGYHEHTSRDVRRIFNLWENETAVPGHNLVSSLGLQLPEPPTPGSRPARRQWLLTARIDVTKGRGLSASRILCGVLSGDNAPVVDGSGFLPLYEFGKTNKS